MRALREFDAAAVEDVFSDGLLNVMAAPEFAQSDKLRRVFAALEDRATLGGLVDRVAGGGGVRVFIGRENPSTEMATCPWSSPRTADPAARSGWSASWGRGGWPTRRPSAPSASCRG